MNKYPTALSVMINNNRIIINHIGDGYYQFDNEEPISYDEVITNPDTYVMQFEISVRIKVKLINNIPLENNEASNSIGWIPISGTNNKFNINL